MISNNRKNPLSTGTRHRCAGHARRSLNRRRCLTDSVAATPVSAGMSGQQAGPGLSAALALLLFCCLFSGLQLGAATLRSSEALTIAGGAACSGLFLLALTFASNAKEAMRMSRGAQWPEVCAALAVAVASAASIHRVSATTCFFFSCGVLYELTKVSAAVWDGGAGAGGALAVKAAKAKAGAKAK